MKIPHLSSLLAALLALFFSCPTLATSTQARPQAASSSSNPATARPQATDTSRVLLMTQNTYGFSTVIQNVKSGGAEPNKTKFFIGNTDVTSKTRFKALANDQLEVSLNLKEPLKAQANLEVRLETSKRGGGVVESRVAVDIVAKVVASDTTFWVEKDSNFDGTGSVLDDEETLLENNGDPIETQGENLNLRFPLYFNGNYFENEIVVLESQVQSASGVVVDVPVSFEDEVGNILNINQASEIGIDVPSFYRGTSVSQGKGILRFKVTAQMVSANVEIPLPAIRFVNNVTAQTQKTIKAFSENATGICFPMKSRNNQIVLFQNGPSRRDRGLIGIMQVRISNLIRQGVRTIGPQRPARALSSRPGDQYHGCLFGDTTDYAQEVTPNYRDRYGNSTTLPIAGQGRRPAILFDGLRVIKQPNGTYQSRIIEAKYTDNWQYSIYNPNGINPRTQQPFGSTSAANQRQTFLGQADRLLDLAALRGTKGVTYYTNSPELATYLQGLFVQAFLEEIQQGALRIVIRKCP